MIRIAALLAVLASVPLTAHAQPYPSKLIRIIVPWTAGGTADILARLIGQKLSESLGQQALADNRPGASGHLGTELAA